MKIVSNSIKDLTETNNILDNLGSELSEQGVVYFTIDSFKFENELEEKELIFSIDNLKAIYPKFAQKIAGTMDRCTYQSSREIIDLYVYCGAYYWERPTSKNDIKEELRAQAEINLKTFWDEIEKNFTMPPTDAFIHEGARGSAFDEYTYWTFCYIYLNQNTHEGIVLSGDCSS